jgi:predicted kinase
MAIIVLCCGKVCSGKSTFASFLETEYAYHHFSIDDWMLHFYDQTTDRTIFESRLHNCAEMIHRITEKLLDRGQNVVLDFGFWKKSDRTDIEKRYRSRGHTVHIVYFPVEDGFQIQYMRKRQSDARVNHYTFDEQTVRTLNAFFEAPKEDEQCLSRQQFIDSVLNNTA